MKRTLAIIAVLAVVLAAAIVLGARFAWGANAGSIHMWIALGLGAGVSFLLGAGLMALSFHSHATGYDDAAAGDE